MASLLTLNIVHPERSPSALAISVHMLRKPRDFQDIRTRVPSLTHRGVFGRAVCAPEDNEMMEVLRMLNKLRVMQEKRNKQLIMSAPAFLSEYHERTVPRLTLTWESEETEVNAGEVTGLVIPPLRQAASEFLVS
ncbi:hypothetical protein BC628DRAFT_1385101 [Trametes gibbosa]|nr:hypothetical protein BC628DRAFT_1385101 [Trametes gibbosa]